MSKTKKTKAYRTCIRNDYKAGHYICHGGDVNAWIIPDGAPIPLPASVRRVMRAVKMYLNAEDNQAADVWLTKLAKAHQAAEARRKGGGK